MRTFFIHKTPSVKAIIFSEIFIHLKRSVIISTKHDINKLSHDLPNDFRLLGKP